MWRARHTRLLQIVYQVNQIFTRFVNQFLRDSLRFEASPKKQAASILTKSDKLTHLSGAHIPLLYPQKLGVTRDTIRTKETGPFP